MSFFASSLCFPRLLLEMGWWVVVLLLSVLSDLVGWALPFRTGAFSLVFQSFHLISPHASFPGFS